MQALAIATSALIAQTAVVNVVAENIANAVTPGYTAKTASLFSMNPGVRVGAILDTQGGASDASPLAGGDINQVDLAGELATLMMARTAYRSALKVFSASEQMSNALLKSV
jgi:flagellar hook protein FlgE